MKRLVPDKSFLIRAAVACGGGLLLAAAFPRPGIAGLAWVAPAVLLFSAVGASRREAFQVGYLGGLSFHLAALYWLVLIPVPIAPIVAWVALSAFLALFFGLWLTLSWWLFPEPINPDNTRLSPAGMSAWLDNLLRARWVQRARWALLCAALWVSFEMLQARIFSGFPWNLLGASQYRILPLIQIASITGVYGVSFLVVWTSAALFCGGAALIKQPRRRHLWSIELFLPVVALCSCVIIGMRVLFRRPPPSTPLQIALVQPSIPQTTIWDPDANAIRFRRLLELSEAALKNHVDLLVWPEAAVPPVPANDTNRFNGLPLGDAIRDLARRHHVWMVIGADDSEINPQRRGEIHYFNAD